MASDRIDLPETINEWNLEAPPRRIDTTNIFDYMNGAGELYLSYHFDHLMVYEYSDGKNNEILVEIYHMENARDAFGLLSLDWGGESVTLGNPREDPAAAAVIPTISALYGHGLLRARAGNLYIRIMALRERPGVRDVILQLGEMIAAGRENAALPALLSAVEPSTDSAWALRRDRTAYFYSHLVLNSLFYLSHENILNLGPSTEAVIVTYEHPEQDTARRSVRLLIITYQDAADAANAWTHFAAAYLPDKDREGNYFQIEDGWLAYRQTGRYLTLVFGCPDQECARDILSRAVVK